MPPLLKVSCSHRWAFLSWLDLVWDIGTIGTWCLISIGITIRIVWVWILEVPPWVWVPPMNGIVARMDYRGNREGRLAAGGCCLLPSTCHAVSCFSSATSLCYAVVTCSLLTVDWKLQIVSSEKHFLLWVLSILSHQGEKVTKAFQFYLPMVKIIPSFTKPKNKWQRSRKKILDSKNVLKSNL